MKHAPSWRERFAPVIRKIIREHEGQPKNVVRKALRDWWGNALMGPREHHPYKIFLDEIRVQLGETKTKKSNECEGSMFDLAP